MKALKRRAPLAAAAVFIGLAIVSTGVAAKNPSLNATPVPGGTIPLKKPAGNQQTTVVVQLAGDPVTVVDANATTPLTQAQKNTLIGQLKAKQAPVEASIKSIGGMVLNSYQSAYNGIKVLIPANKTSQLASISGVIGVHALPVVKPDNIHGVPLVGAPSVWDGLNGFHGEGVKIAIIDTGIDYTHADFGGPGTVAAWMQAKSMSTADPTLTSVCETAALTPCFGPDAPKVKGGVDLVGDSYDANPNDAGYQPIPHPDPNPLDCFGHGSHVAGTAAGFGVLSNGSTYTGPYNANTVSSHTWNVGPGVAPKADLYAVRIFGCAGSTNETIDGIEWAVDHNMDVINMSLGSPFGPGDSPDAVAASNAAKDGIIVVASSGNEGTNAYVTGTPASGDNVLSVAASDPTQTFPAATMNLTKADGSSGGTLTAINANGLTPLPSGSFKLVNVPRTAHDAALGDPDPNLSLGCSVADDQAAVPGGNLSHTIIVVARGVCARVAKAIFGQQAGAAGVIMVNNAAGYPPFEGPITSDPDPPGPPLFGGFPYNVTIPFLGVPGGPVPSASAAGQQLAAANNGSIALTATTLNNPGYLGLASFSSRGPRTGDSAMKPEVTAPGVSIASVGMGTGNQAAILSGTSMAAPHTSGSEALVKQAHPTWKKVVYWKAALENTADPSLVAGYNARGAGVGLIQVQNAVKTQVVVVGPNSIPAINYGFAELDKNFSKKLDVQLWNFSNTAITFNIGHTLDAGSPHTIVPRDSQIRVSAGGAATTQIELDVPAATAGTGGVPGVDPFADVSGLITFTPVGGANNGVTLRLPYYFVPQSISHVSTAVNTTQLQSSLSTTATTTNKGGVIPGNADWYAWGLTDPKENAFGANDLQAVGAQTFPDAGVLAFAVSTWKRWSNAAQVDFDILVDVNNDGTPDYLVEAADLGALTGQDFNGEDAVAVFALATGNGSIDFLADAPTDSSTIVLPVLFDQLCVPGNPCLSDSNPRFTYTASAMDIQSGSVDQANGSAKFNAFTPAISTGMFDVVPPGGSASEPITINASEWAQSPPLGLMIVSHQNPSSAEAQLIKVSPKLP